MGRVVRVTVLLVANLPALVLLVATSLTQSSGPPSHIAVMDPEEVLVSTTALSDLVAKQNPDRIFLRDTTQTRGFHLAIHPSLREIPDDVKADFDSRNDQPAPVTLEAIQFPVELKLLSHEEELNLVQAGEGCEQKTPIVFLSRPGLDSKRETALIIIGTACGEGSEHASYLLLKKGRSGWAVSSNLGTSNTIIEADLPKITEPKIVSVRRSDAGAEYLLDVSFLTPDIPDESYNYFSVYGTRIVEGQRSNDKNYAFLYGQWKPNERVEFSVRVPKESSDSTKGWILTFCVGSMAPNPAQPGSFTSKCYPSANLLTRISQNDKAQPQ